MGATPQLCTASLAGNLAALLATSCSQVRYNLKETAPAPNTKFTGRGCGGDVG
jgi:hypothetical protein